MSDRILVVRTLNIEEMGPLLDSCSARWPRARMCILTSPNRRAELSSDPRVDEVMDYETTASGFRASWNDGRSYLALVIPTRNSEGWGYGNVWEAISCVNAESYWVAAWGRELHAVSLRRMLWRARIERFVKTASGGAAWIMARLLLLIIQQDRKGIL